MNRAERRSNDFDIKKYIKASNEIEGIYDPNEDLQSLNAWAYLEQLTTLAHVDIMRVQKIITINQANLSPNQRGWYRGMAGNITNVSVGGRNAPDYSYVEDLMKQWLLDVPEMTPLTAHIRFEAIHPFVDGNGRTGRMLYWFICKKRGIKPYYYSADTEKDRQHYYRLFEHKLVIKLSNMKWRFTPDKMQQGEDDKPVKFVGTEAMNGEHITPLFDSEAAVWDYLYTQFADEAGVLLDDADDRARFEEMYDVIGLDAIDIKIMENPDLEWWK
jgi:hypothetical protein